MPWHQSQSVPTKVYDSRHEAVCICASPDQAALIVKAVNALGPDAQGSFVKLRETPPGGEVTSGHSGEQPLVHVTQAEGCCAKHIGKASLSGVLNNLQPWECPKCGTTYWPKRAGPTVNWTARADAVIFRL